jgi:hypothetical protein
MDGLLLRKCIVEFIGGFFLIFVIGCVSSQARVFLGPLAIGAALMVMIFAAIEELFWFSLLFTHYSKANWSFAGYLDLLTFQTGKSRPSG